MPNRYLVKLVLILIVLYSDYKSNQFPVQVSWRYRKKYEGNKGQI